MMGAVAFSSTSATICSFEGDIVHRRRSLFDPEKKQLHVRGEKSLNFALKPLRSREKNSCVFEAENRSISLQSSLFDPERKNSSCSRVKIAEFAACFEAENSLNFALKRPLDPERNDSCMFEAKNSLNFALKQRLQPERNHGCMFEAENAQFRSRAASLLKNSFLTQYCHNNDAINDSYCHNNDVIML